MSILIGILTLAILLVIGMRLAERLGYPFWYGLGVGIPIVNLFILAAFAFNPSPRERRIEELERELAALRHGTVAQLTHESSRRHL